MDKLTHLFVFFPDHMQYCNSVFQEKLLFRKLLLLFFSGYLIHEMGLHCPRETRFQVYTPLHSFQCIRTLLSKQWKGFIHSLRIWGWYSLYFHLPQTIYQISCLLKIWTCNMEIFQTEVLKLFIVNRLNKNYMALVLFNYLCSVLPLKISGSQVCNFSFVFCHLLCHIHQSVYKESKFNQQNPLILTTASQKGYPRSAVPATRVSLLDRRSQSTVKGTGS